MSDHDFPRTRSGDPVEASRSIQRRTGRTFYLATRLFPRRIRRATHVLYAFFRLADEVVDDGSDRAPEERRRELQSLRDAALGDETPDDAVLREFRRVKERYDIPDAEVEAFLESMEADVSKSRYDTREELEAYMRGSAAAVGNMMTAIVGATDGEAARPHAEALGEAFQLTNFLRDVREDVVDLDRIYLPRETLRRHGSDESDVEELAPTLEFRRALETELRWAEQRYRVGVAGIGLLAPDCQFPVLLAAVYSAEYHRLIRRQGFDVLSRRPQLGTGRMLALLLRTRWHWARTRNPETVFSATSAVSRSERDDADVGRVGGRLGALRGLAEQYGR